MNNEALEMLIKKYEDKRDILIEKIMNAETYDDVKIEVNQQKLLKEIICDLQECEGKSEPDNSSGLWLHSVINWVAIEEMKPDTEWGDFFVCLKNGFITHANYSTIGEERWLMVGVGRVGSVNPVVYWAKIPEPPCL